MSKKDAKIRIKTGTNVHLCPDAVDYRAAWAMALRFELGATYRAIKTVMRWTGASERIVKHWFAGEGGLSGQHLILPARHSHMVFHMILIQAGHFGAPDAREGQAAKGAAAGLLRGESAITAF